jgi:hypothetical protein
MHVRNITRDVNAVGDSDGIYPFDENGVAEVPHELGEVLLKSPDRFEQIEDPALTAKLAAEARAAEEAAEAEAKAAAEAELKAAAAAAKKAATAKTGK